MSAIRRNAPLISTHPNMHASFIIDFGEHLAGHRDAADAADGADGGGSGTERDVGRPSRARGPGD